MTFEEVAAFAHERWCTWMHWMDAHWNDTHASGELFLDRWHRQSETPYDELSEQEKDSDRQEAASWMNVLGVGQLRAEGEQLKRERDEARAICTELVDECDGCATEERYHVALHERDEGRTWARRLLREAEESAHDEYHALELLAVARAELAEERAAIQHESDALLAIRNTYKDAIARVEAIITEQRPSLDTLGYHDVEEFYPDDDDDAGICADCGSPLQWVRPGKKQCPTCYTRGDSNV